MDQYVDDPSKAVSRGRLPEVGPRGGIRYRDNTSASRRIIPTTIFITDIDGIGIFEKNGRYVAYIRKDNERDKEISDGIRECLANGMSIHEAIERYS